MVAAQEETIVRCLFLEHCPTTRKTADQVIQPAGRNKFTTHAGMCRFLRIVTKEIKVEYLLDGEIRVLGEKLLLESINKRSVTSDILAEQGKEVLLALHGMVLVGIPVQMNGQAGNDANGFLEVDGTSQDCVTVLDKGDTAGNTEVTIEPGAEKGAAIDFNAKLAIGAAVPQGEGFYLQCGAVGVRPCHSPG